MNLCLDIGNTRIKLAIYDDRSLVYFDHLDQKEVREIYKLYEQYDICHTAMCSTRKENFQLQNVLHNLGPLLVLDDTTDLPIEIDYKTPKTLGRDRIAAATGAWCQTPESGHIVIDAGTCITLDYIDQNGIYHGGNISPGIRMRLEAMHHFTAKLPLVAPVHNEDYLGKSTETALQNGAVRGTIWEIESFIEQVLADEKKVNINLTGGDADFLAKNLKKHIFVSPNLVLEGLNEILLYNVKTL